MSIFVFIAVDLQWLLHVHVHAPCVAMCCNVLQCVVMCDGLCACAHALCCTVLQRAAMCCNVLH